MIIKSISGNTSAIAIALIGVLIFSLASATGCSGSSEFAAPEFVEQQDTVIVITPAQLYAEYTADEAAATAKYKGKRLSFIGVTAERVSNYLYDPRATEFYVIVDSVYFEPMYLDYIDSVLEGFVLDIVGEVRGLIFGTLYISGCWIEIVEGDGSGFVAPLY